MNKMPRFEIYALVLGCACLLFVIWSLHTKAPSEINAVAYSENMYTNSNTVDTETAVTSHTTEVQSTVTLASTTPPTEATPPVEIEEEPKPKPEPKKHVVVAAPIVVAPVVTKPTPVIDLSAAVVDSVAMLAAHNEVRLSHNLTPLTWSKKLAVSAQSWSDQLKTESCKMRHDLDSPYGENIYWESLIGGGVDMMVSSDRDPVVWWANEEKFYNYDKNTCRRGEQCGHYTQLVWAETTEVGCGVSSCILGDERRDLWVCRYNPPGNYEGMQPY